MEKSDNDSFVRKAFEEANGQFIKDMSDEASKAFFKTFRANCIAACRVLGEDEVDAFLLKAMADETTGEMLRFFYIAGYVDSYQKTNSN